MSYRKLLCPHCGNEIDETALFCPRCGSDAQTGFKEGALFSDLDLPDYEEILENEFPEFKRKSIFIKIATFLFLFVFLFSIVYFSAVH